MHMTKLWEGQFPGTFAGYMPGRIHTLPGGSYWIQVGGPIERATDASPWAALLRDEGGATYLDVAGMGERVLVRRV